MTRRNPKVLLVDDSAESLEALRAGLSDLAAELVLASSGREALRLAMHAEELAVVVLDVAMPGLGGFEVAELLRESPRFSATPIIFMTGVAMDQHEVFRGYDLGAVDYIFKPVDSHVLRSKVGVFVKLWQQAEELQILNQSLEQRVRDSTRQLQTEEHERRRAEDARSDLEQQLRQAQKLEAIGTLASGVAHDFNNLLMGISGCSTVALSLLEPDHPARAYLSEIKRSTQSGAAITRQLLTFSRKRATEETVFQLNEVVINAEQLLKRLLREDIEFVLSLTQADSRVRSDPGQVEQILMNLAVNARDAMPEGGRIEIRTELVELTEQAANARKCRPGRYLGLSVSDSGAGMSQATRARVFEPFFTTKEVGKGTGLGLSTVYGIVKRAGGDIELTSEPGEGTCVRVLLPHSGESIESDAPPAPVVQAPAGKTVLLAEDDPLVRMTVRHFLDEGGYRVFEASTGPDALEVLTSSAGEIDLLLTDTVLPGMSGPQLIVELERRGLKMPAVLMSAHSAEWLAGEGRIAAGTRTLQKPFGKQTLLARLADVLGERARDLHPAPPEHREPSEGRGALAARAVSSARQQATAEVPAQQQRTILVVEDQSAARLAIVDFLASLDYAVLEAAHPEEALRQAQERSIGLVLTDYSLPGMTGDALARELRRLWPEVAVVYMSGHEGLKPDPEGPVLKKPIELALIAERIASIVGASANPGAGARLET